jgi:hypothetical protein
MIAVAASRSLNAVLPASAERCRKEIEGVAAGFAKPQSRAAANLVTELVSCYPHLNSKDGNMRIFMGKLSLVFEAHSVAAARHILDPVNGFVGSPDWLSIGNINQALETFENDQRAVVAAAEWIIAEHARRELVAAEARQIEAEKGSFPARHEGKSPLEFAKEQLRQ